MRKDTRSAWADPTLTSPAPKRRSRTFNVVLGVLLTIVAAGIADVVVVVVMRIGPAVCGGDGRVRVGACGSEPGGSRGCRNACSDSSGGGLYRGRYGVCVAVVRATRGRPLQLVNRD